MLCDEIRIKLSTYLDHELESEILRQVDEHLVKCAGCREELEALQTVDRRIMDLPMPRFSEGFTEKVMSSAIKSENDKKHERIRRAIVSTISFFQNFFDLVKSKNGSSTQTLEEFGDFPPCSLGSVYIKLIQ